MNLNEKHARELVSLDGFGLRNLLDRTVVWLKYFSQLGIICPQLLDRHPRVDQTGLAPYLSKPVFLAPTSISKSHRVEPPKADTRYYRKKSVVEVSTRTKMTKEQKTKMIAGLCGKPRTLLCSVFKFPPAQARPRHCSLEI